VEAWSRYVPYFPTYPFLPISKSPFLLANNAVGSIESQVVTLDEPSCN